MAENRSQGPYASAFDLPSIQELLKQTQGMKLLTLLVGRKHRRDVLEIERQVRAMAERVDAFYALLGDRHWIFHDELNYEAVTTLLTLDADAAEQALIDCYRDEEALSFMVMRLRGLDAMRPRMALVERAREDYVASRYYSVVLVLLAVMDGFVNEVDTSQRRGLHARDAKEMSAWDSVVGHHLGLTHAHSVFTKSTCKTSDEPIFELQRNGIMHGTLVNYDNPIVATKAWNRLFAIADWARSLEKATIEPEPKPTWRGVAKSLIELEETKRALAEWRPSELTPDDPAFSTNEVVQQSRDYLKAWQAKNYGRMASLVAPVLGGDTIGQTAGMVRETFAEWNLVDYDIDGVRFEAAAIAELDIRLTIEEAEQPGRMRWVRETDDGSPATPNQDGVWRLWSWGAWDMIARAELIGEPPEDSGDPEGS